MEQSLAVKTFEDLFAELGERARTRPPGSATVAALDGGVHGLGKKILDRVAETIGDGAKIEAEPRLDGRNMTMVLAPQKRAKQNDHKPQAEAGETAVAVAEPVAGDETTTGEE